MIKQDESGVRQICSRAELLELAEELGVREDWHEPDEQAVEAIVFGETFDNAGFWGRRFRLEQSKREFPPREEMSVLLMKDDKPVAEVNLATLFSWACGFND